MTQASPDAGAKARPSNRSVEHENQRPTREGEPPRPATEPVGAAKSSQTGKTRADPGSGRN